MSEGYVADDNTVVYSRTSQGIGQLQVAFWMNSPATVKLQVWAVDSS